MSLIVFFVLLFLSAVYAVYSVIPKRNKTVEAPTKYDIEIKVDLSNCAIKSNHYSEEVEKGGSIRMQMIDGLYGESNSTSTSTTQSIICIELPDKNGKIKKYYSAPIYMEEDMIRFRIEEQKFTTLYIDSTDDSKYYLDITFLYK